METPKADAAVQPTAAQLETAVNEARAAGFADAAQIVDLCAIAGNLSLATKFITEKKSAADVRASLVDLRAKGQLGEDLNTTVMPGVDAKAGKETQGKAKPWSEVMSALGGKKEKK